MVTTIKSPKAAAITTTATVDFSKIPQADVKATVVPEQHTSPEEAGATFAATVESAFKMLGINMPSGTRTMLSLLASIVVAGVVGYAGSVLLGYLMVGALMLTGSAFITLAVAVLAVALTMYAGWKASGYVAGYIMSGAIDNHYHATNEFVAGKFNAVKGWFTKPKLQATTAAA